MQLHALAHLQHPVLVHRYVRKPQNNKKKYINPQAYKQVNRFSCQFSPKLTGTFHLFTHQAQDVHTENIKMKKKNVKTFVHDDYQGDVNRVNDLDANIFC